MKTSVAGMVAGSYCVTLRGAFMKSKDANDAEHAPPSSPRLVTETLLKSRTILLFGEINTALAAEVTARLLALGVGGPASDIEIEARQVLAVRERLNRIFARETGQPYEKIARDTERNLWMSAQEAKDYGLVHRIVESSREL
jgi:ATP-dependent protease ClpP protease subunit